MRILPTAILTLAVCCAATASATEVYRWTDEKGVTHYSDTPPNHARYERVNVRTGKADSRAEAEPEAEAADATPPPAQPQVDPAVRAERCATAQRNLAMLRSNIEVTVEIEGQTHVLTAEEREQRVAQNERAVATHCDTP